MENNYLPFLTTDYQLKVDYLKGHLSRLWLRFNYFLSIELALFGLLGFLLFKQESPNVAACIFPIAIGIAVSVLWCFIGIQDRALVKIYSVAIKYVTFFIKTFQR